MSTLTPQATTIEPVTSPAPAPSRSRPGDTGVLVAMDKFRGSATALALGDTIARVVREHHLSVDVQPMSDGGEGFVDAFDGETVVVSVPGPLGDEVPARIRLHETPSGLVGVLEVSDVVGRDLLLAPTGAQALRATSAGVGHLIAAAQLMDVAALLVGCGGTATSDGGLGCYEVLARAGGLRVPVTAATDVTARFYGALDFAPQKGVTSEDLSKVRAALTAARATYLREHRIDVESLDRAGAAGGIAGALAALGATLTSGFSAVSEARGLARRAKRSGLVITGEGRFDWSSLDGKVPAGVASLVVAPTRLVVVCGSLESDAAAEFSRDHPDATLVSLVERFGRQRARRDTLACVALAVHDVLSGFAST